MSAPYLPVYVNGEILPADEAQISVFDRGFMRGDGVFETLRSYVGTIFRLDEHLARLDRGMEVLRYPLRTGDLDVRDAVLETLRVSAVMDARIRVQVTRGAGSTEFNAHTETPPTVVITVHPIVAGESKPLRVIISSVRRDQMSPLAGIKTINYLPSLLARLEAEDAGADDAILLNYAGRVAEGCSSNVFLVKDGRLITPDAASGILPGIIRATIIEIASAAGMEVEEREVEPDELEWADEVFLTSSSREAAPVESIDGRRVRSGSHEATNRLEEEYRRLAEGR